MRGIFANCRNHKPLSLDEACLDVSEVSDETLTATRIAKAIRQCAKMGYGVGRRIGQQIYRQGRL